MTFEEHMKLLPEFLKCLRRYSFYLKPKKCTIAADQVDLLGHLITQEGVKPSPSKIQAIVDYPAPTNKTELRAFLGLIGYYQNFINGCSVKLQPLSKLLQEHVAFSWDDKGEQGETFRMVKTMLMDTKNLLIRPDFDKIFILQTDASALGFGAVLSQAVEKGDKPIAYASKRATPTQANYGSTQLEIHAVIWAIEHFKHYLLGAPFQLVTDHAPI
jgi:hypothetical protein